MALPKLTPEEKIAALKKAQEVRAKRSRLREDLKAGKKTLRDVFAAAARDDVVARMKVSYLLESLPRVGKVRREKIMDEVGIDESRRVKGLGVRQRDALLERVGK